MIKFEEIKAVKIADLDTRWAVDLKTMARFAKLCIVNNGISDGKKHEWANILYPGDISTGMIRIDNFINTSISIKNNGYLTLLNCLETDCKLIDPEHGTYGIKNKIITHSWNTLPLIRDGKDIHDGRHRLAALMALGTEKTHVVMINFSNEPQKTTISELREFGEDIVAAIKVFQRDNCHKNPIHSHASSRQI